MASRRTGRAMSASRTAQAAQLGAYECVTSSIQPMLMPVDMREWLPEDDLVFVVLDAVAALELGEFRRRYRADGHGRAAVDPEMMIAHHLGQASPQYRSAWSARGHG